MFLLPVFILKFSIHSAFQKEYPFGRTTHIFQSYSTCMWRYVFYLFLLQGRVCWLRPLEIECSFSWPWGLVQEWAWDPNGASKTQWDLAGAILRKALYFQLCFHLGKYSSYPPENNTRPEHKPSTENREPKTGEDLNPDEVNLVSASTLECEDWSTPDFSITCVNATLGHFLHLSIQQFLWTPPVIEKRKSKGFYFTTAIPP